MNTSENLSDSGNAWAKLVTNIPRPVSASIKTLPLGAYIERQEHRTISDWAIASRRPRMAVKTIWVASRSQQFSPHHEDKTTKHTGRNSCVHSLMGDKCGEKCLGVGLCNLIKIILNKRIYPEENAKKKPLQKPSPIPKMSFFVGGHTLRLTGGRAFRCTFLENQLAGLRALYSSDGLYVTVVFRARTCVFACVRACMCMHACVLMRVSR